MYRSVLVVIDHAPRSRLALLDAADLALASHARLTIMCPAPHVPLMAHPPVVAGIPSVSVAQLADDARRACLELRDSAVAAVALEVPVTTVMAPHRTPKAILEEIARGRHDLVVIATRPAVLWAPWRTAFARRLARRCPVPVLTVPEPRRARLASRPTRRRPVRVGAPLAR
jgi:nucleotide-binding universal stress UspA family protein